MLSSDQKKIIVGGSAGVIFALIFIYTFYSIFPFPIPMYEDRIERFYFALEWNLLPVLMVMLGVIIVALNRFTTDGIDPIMGITTDRLKINKQYLQNTFEQAFMFVFLSLIMSLSLTGESLRFIPILTLLFVIGRISFLIGYHIHPSHRAFGMTINEVTTYGPAIYLIYRLFEMHNL